MLTVKMLRRHLLILIALAGSVAVHLVLWRTAEVVRVRPANWAMSVGRGVPEHHLMINLADAPKKKRQPEKKRQPAEMHPKASQPAKSSEPIKLAEPVKPVPQIKKLPPTVVTPPLVQPKRPDIEKYPDKMGDLKGKGIGLNAAEGLVPLKAREAEEDQAFLSRDPRGPGHVGDPPSRSTWAQGEGGHGGVPGTALRAPTVAPPAPLTAERLELLPPETAPLNPAPSAVKQSAPMASSPLSMPPVKFTAPPRPSVRVARAELVPQLSPGPLQAIQQKPFTALSEPTRPTADLVETARPVTLAPRDVGPDGLFAPPVVAQLPTTPPPASAPPMPIPVPEPSVSSILPPPIKVAGGDSRKPGPRLSSADPAQMSDSESDPFAKIGSLNLRDGRLEVQFGRKVKTVRPKIPIVGTIDAFAMDGTAVTLKVNIDATGTVTGVEIAKSSGSNEIDQPCLIAMYKWWFEPLKDKHGKAVPDVVLFTIIFK